MRTLVVGTAALAIAVASCTNANPSESGGEPRFDPNAPPPTVVCGGDPNADAGDGHTFAALYRDYFGPTARAGCAGGQGLCHGSADAQGATASGGFVCASASGCWQGMKDAGYFAVLTPPDQSPVYAHLRTCSQVGDVSRMPKTPSDVTFSNADLKRIADWLSEGAPDN